ncbi:MAG TPA: alginate lyase family protein [Pirellulales bacterium]|nr:alginate lyase family protein [Pirellulales bacterium]
MNRFAKMYWMVRAVGWENVPRRAWHIAKGRLGLDRSDRLKHELADGHLERAFTEDYAPGEALTHWRRRAERFFTGPAQLDRIRPVLREVADDARWHEQVGSLVEALPTGRMLLFHHHLANVGWPVDFHRDPLHDVSWPAGQSRRSYRQFDPRFKDLKCLWEASRFQVGFLLARDAARDPASPAGELFWQLVDAWDRQNPFGASAQWVCGQEATFRLMSWLFVACAFVGEHDARPERYHRLTELAYLTGRLIEDNIVYARSQKNNHAISEAAGLWTLGLLFPELRRAEGWRAWGRRVICEEVARQIQPDGSYVQHSLNYHRVMLDDMLWAMQLGALHGDPIAEVHGPIGKALAWLLAMIEPTTGGVPNYGPNDGALILPLSTCDYTDFRPVAQAAHYVLHGTRAFPPGPWDEEMLWLCGAGSRAAPIEPAGHSAPGKRRAPQFQAPQGGYYTTTGPNSWLFTRIHSYHDRPTQADMLHVDLWYRGVNLLRDGGSFQYYCEQPWQHFFESTAGHNTVEVDELDQMERGPSFLWFRWTEARCLADAFSLDGQASFIAGEHYGYRRLPGRVVHRRSIFRAVDTYVIIDDLLGSGSHQVALRWRLAPLAWREEGHAWCASVEGQELSLNTTCPDGFTTEMCRGVEGTRPEGWESLYYAERVPVPTLVTRGTATLPARLVTVVGPADAGIRLAKGAALNANGKLRLAGVATRELATFAARYGMEAVPED